MDQLKECSFYFQDNLPSVFSKIQNAVLTVVLIRRSAGAFKKLGSRMADRKSGQGEI